MWVLNTYYITEDSFPTIHRRSSIIKKVTTELSPLEIAFKTVSEKNKEIKELLVKHDLNNTQNPPPLQELTMVLKGYKIIFFIFSINFL